MKKARQLALLFAAQIAFAEIAQASIIGVDIEAGNGSPTNWTSYTLLDVGSAKTNLVREDGSVSGVSFTLFGVVSTQNFSADSATDIPSHSNDLSSVCCDLLHSGPNPTIATWSDLTPLTLYRYWVFTSSAADDEITATGNGSDGFGSPGVNHLSQRINGILGDSSLTFDSYARQIMSSASGTIDIEILSQGTPTPSGYALESLGPAVPEPATLALLSLGLAGFAVGRRRKAWLV